MGIFPFLLTNTELNNYDRLGGKRDILLANCRQIHEQKVHHSIYYLALTIKTRTANQHITTVHYVILCPWITIIIVHRSHRHIQHHNNIILCFEYYLLSAFNNLFKNTGYWSTSTKRRTSRILCYNYTMAAVCTGYALDLGFFTAFSNFIVDTKCINMKDCTRHALYDLTIMSSNMHSWISMSWSC